MEEFSRKGVDYQFAIEIFIHHTRNLLHSFTGGLSEKTLHPMKLLTTTGSSQNSV